VVERPCDQIEALIDQIDRLDRAIVTEARRDEDMSRLSTIPGVAPLRQRPSKRLCRILAGSNQSASLPPGLD